MYIYKTYGDVKRLRYLRYKVLQEDDTDACEFIWSAVLSPD